MNNNTMASTGGSNAPAGGVGGTQQHRLDLSHPFFVGADIVRQAKYVELDEQVRAEGDPFHVKVVERLYKGGGICRSDLEKYKLLSEDDYKGSQAGQGPLDSGWHRAPTIVTTNRERYSLTHEAAAMWSPPRRLVPGAWLAARHLLLGAPIDSCQVSIPVEATLLLLLALVN